MFVISRILSHETLDVVIWQMEDHRPLKIVGPWDFRRTERKALMTALQRLGTGIATCIKGHVDREHCTMKTNPSSQDASSRYILS